MNTAKNVIKWHTLIVKTRGSNIVVDITVRLYSYGYIHYSKEQLFGIRPNLNVVNKIKKAVEAPCNSASVSIRFFIELK